MIEKATIDDCSTNCIIDDGNRLHIKHAQLHTHFQMIYIRRNKNVCKQFKMGQSLSMTPYQKFQIIFEKLIRFTSTSLGLMILDKSFKLYHSIFISMLAFSVVVFSIYTMFAFDAETSFKGTTCLSLGLQVEFN